MTSPREIELKLELEPARISGRNRPPRGLPPGGETRHLLSRIYDTTDHALQRNGLVLRVRRDGERRVQTVKAPGQGGLLDRIELETDLAGDEPDLTAIPDEAIRAELQGAGPLAPVLETEVERTLWHLRREGSDLELALDIGAIRAGSASTPVREVEIELKSGSIGSIFDLAREIVGAMPARIGVQSKSERGYNLLTPAGRDALKPRLPQLAADMPTRQAFQAIARSCISHFRLCEPGIVGREAEALHQGRVAIRRLRSAFKLFKPMLAGPEAERLKRSLRRLFQRLGEARNLDVYLKRSLAADDARQPGEAGLTEFRERIARDREAAYDRAVRMLGTKRHRLFMIDLLAFVENGAWLRGSDAAEARSRPLAAYARKWLDKRWRRLAKEGRHLVRLDAAARHRVRIDGKVLRYAVEFFGGAFPGRKSRKRQKVLAGALGALQDALGDLNDIDTGDRMAEGLAAGPDGAAIALVAAGHSGDDREAAEARLLEAACIAHAAIRDSQPFWR